jgi:hypothetical protein
MPMEHTPFQGVDQTRCDSHMLFGGPGVPVWGLPLGVGHYEVNF